MKERFEFFLWELTDDGIAILFVNRPQVKNAMNTASWTEFLEFLTDAEADERIRAIVISGTGDAFIAGADINEIVGAPVSAALFTVSAQVVRLIETGYKPVIAAVNGAAFGGGFEVALACDVRVVAPQAIFGLPEPSLGLLPGMGGTQHLCKIIGSGRAKEVLMVGRNIRGEEAAALGLAMKCVPQEELLDAALKAARKMLERGPKALALIKRCINLAYSTDDATGMLVENLAFCALMRDWESAEGVQAFLQKRKPNFSKQNEV